MKTIEIYIEIYEYIIHRFYKKKFLKSNLIRYVTTNISKIRNVSLKFIMNNTRSKFLQFFLSII